MFSKPMRCPKCRHWVNFTYFNTAGWHWVCPACGNNSNNQIIVYGTTTSPINKNYNGEFSPLDCNSQL